jgi:hypothetical protein
VTRNAEPPHVAVFEQQLPSAAPDGARDDARRRKLADRPNAAAAIVPQTSKRGRSASGKTETKRVYTLRVEEQSVGVVLRQLAERLHWRFDVDEEAIRAAGLSLDRRVSFEVQNADENALLEALLTPAQLTFQRDGDKLRIVPKSAATNRD